MYDRAGEGAVFELVGVTSWGDGCGRRGKPGVYADVMGGKIQLATLFIVIFISQAFSALEDFWRPIVGEPLCETP